MDNYGSITEQEVKLRCSDYLRWAKPENCIFECQDQDWLLTLTRNSITSDLDVKVRCSFNKLEGRHQGGVVFIWMMLNTIVHITDDVAKGIQDKIKEFVQKGLTTYKGKNVEAARVELVAICTRLDKQKFLPADSVNDIIEGLAKCSHKGFSLTFAEFQRARKNTLMAHISLKGALMDQILSFLMRPRSITPHTTCPISGYSNNRSMPTTHLLCVTTVEDHTSLQSAPIRGTWPRWPGTVLQE